MTSSYFGVSTMEIEIARVDAVVTYDSRGRPTLDVMIISSKGSVGRYASPSGASVGAYEAPPLPEGGILAARKLVVEEVNRILRGFRYSSQEEFDSMLRRIDGTGRYERLGSIVSLGLSFAAADLASKELGIPMYRWLGGPEKPVFPRPLCNVLGGGKHALNRSIDIQEILVTPLNPPSYRDAYVSAVELHREVAKVLSEKDHFFNGGRNDEGAWVTTLSDEEAFEAVWEAVDRVRSDLGVKFAVGVDMAASSMWDPNDKLYIYRRNGLYMDREEQIEYVIELVRKYRLSYVEDPLHEDDFPGFSLLAKRLGRNVLVVGDDLYVTNLSRIKLGISEKAGNGVIIKPNQVGDITHSMESAREASKAGFAVVVSHRSGETPYPHLAHLALAVGADLFKVSPVYGERVVKHNELVRMEDLYGSEGLKPMRWAG